MNNIFSGDLYLLSLISYYDYSQLKETEVSPRPVEKWLQTVYELFSSNLNNPELFSFSAIHGNELIGRIKGFAYHTSSSKFLECLYLVSSFYAVVQKRHTSDPSWISDYTLIRYAPKIWPAPQTIDRSLYAKDPDTIFLSLKNNQLVFNFLNERNKLASIAVELNRTSESIERVYQEICLRQFVRHLPSDNLIQIFFLSSKFDKTADFDSKIWLIKIANGLVHIQNHRHHPQLTPSEFIHYYNKEHNKLKIDHYRGYIVELGYCEHTYQVEITEEDDHWLVKISSDVLLSSPQLEIDKNGSVTEWRDFIRTALYGIAFELCQNLIGFSTKSLINSNDLSDKQQFIITISSSKEPFQLTLHTKNKAGFVKSEALMKDGTLNQVVSAQLYTLKAIHEVQREFPEISISLGQNPESGEVQINYVSEKETSIFYRSVDGVRMSAKVPYLETNVEILRNEIRAACGCIKVQSFIKELNAELGERWFFEKPYEYNLKQLPSKSEYDPNTVGITYRPDGKYLASPGIHRGVLSEETTEGKKQQAFKLLFAADLEWERLEKEHGAHHIHKGGRITVQPDSYLIVRKKRGVELHFVSVHNQQKCMTFDKASIPSAEEIKLFLNRIRLLREYTKQPNAIPFIELIDLKAQVLAVDVWGTKNRIRIHYPTPHSRYEDFSKWYHQEYCYVEEFAECIKKIDLKYRTALSKFRVLLAAKFGRERLNLTDKPIFKKTATLFLKNHMLEINYVDFQDNETTIEVNSAHSLEKETVENIDKFNSFMRTFCATPDGREFCEEYRVSLEGERLDTVRRYSYHAETRHTHDFSCTLEHLYLILPKDLEKYNNDKNELRTHLLSKFGDGHFLLKEPFSFVKKSNGFDLHYIDCSGNNSQKYFHWDSSKESIENFIRMHQILTPFAMQTKLKCSSNYEEGCICFNYDEYSSKIHIRYKLPYVNLPLLRLFSIKDLECQMQVIINKQKDFIGYLKNVYGEDNVFPDGIFFHHPQHFFLVPKMDRMECHFLDPAGKERMVEFNLFAALPEKAKLESIVQCSLVLNSYSNKPGAIPFIYLPPVEKWVRDLREYCVEGLFVKSTPDYTQLDIQYIDPVTNKPVHHIVNPGQFVEKLAEVNEEYTIALALTNVDTSPFIRKKTSLQSLVPKYLEEGIPDHLETFFKRINFIDEKHPFYMNPRTNAEYGKVVEPKVLLEQLQKLIRIVKDGGDKEAQGGTGYYWGVPQKPEEKLVYYNHLRAYLSQIIVKLKDDKNVPIDRLNDIVVSFAIAGRHCGGRWMGEAIQHYNELYGMEGETLEEFFLGIIDKFKLSIIEELHVKERVSDVHTYLGICRALRKFDIGIPSSAGAEYDDPYAGNALAERGDAIRQSFMERFTAGNIVSWIYERANEQIKAKNNKFNGLLQEKIFNMVHDRIHAHEKERLEGIERTFVQQCAAGHDGEAAKAERRAAIRRLIETEVGETCLIYNDNGELLKVTRKAVLDVMVYAGMLIRQDEKR